MSADSTLISVRLKSDLLQKLDAEAELRSRPGARVTRTTVINAAVARYFGEDALELAQGDLLEEAPPQKPYKCPSVGCLLRSDSKQTVCPTHGRRVVPVG